MLETYKSSGKFGINSIFYLIVASFILMPLLGTAYTYATWYMPIIYINIAFTLLFGFAIGGIIKIIVLKKGKVRNVKMAVLFTLIGALVAYYIHWVIWVNLIRNSGNSIGGEHFRMLVSNIKINQVLNLITEPEYVWDTIKSINKNGTWSFKGQTVSGIALMIVWIFEFLILVGTAIYFAIPAALKPFSEDENRWLNGQKLPKRKRIKNETDFILAINSNNMNPIKELELEKDATASFCQIIIYGTENGKKYIAIYNSISNTNKRGKHTHFSKNHLIHNAVIDESFYQLLQQKKTI